MSEQLLSQQPATAACLPRILNDAQYRRLVAARSGLSEVTLRKIAMNGKVDSFVSAVALQHATDGELVAEAMTDDSTKGARFYRNRSARALLDLATKEGMTIARLLGRHSLTTLDLWTFVHAAHGKCNDTKERVSKVLLELGLPVDRGDAQ